MGSALKANLDAACARLQEQAHAEAEPPSLATRPGAPPTRQRLAAGAAAQAVRSPRRGQDRPQHGRQQLAVRTGGDMEYRPRQHPLE